MSNPKEAAHSFLLRSANPDAYKPPDTVERATRYKANLREFVVAAWPEKDPTPFPLTWHGGAIRDKLEAPQIVEESVSQWTPA